MATTLTICSPGAVPSSLPQPSSAAAEQYCRRQYAPSVWGDFFITHQLCTPEELLSMQEKASAKKEEVRRIVLDAAAAAATASGSDGLVRNLELVDALQRLGVDYHYKEEIDALLRAVHEDHHDHGASASSDDLYVVTSLRFYLLRKHGYAVSSDKDVNRPSFRAGGVTEGQKIIHQIQAPECRSPKTTILLGCTEVPQEHIWSDYYMGHPMKQEVPDTCALVAATKCVEAVHRLEHEKLHGNGKGTTTTTMMTFPYSYRAAPPSDLLEACRIDGVWKPRVGAYVRDVLIEIHAMGGVPTINAATLGQRFLPLLSWQEHRWDDGSAAGGLSPERVADLLYNNGPCIGVLWVISQWYQPIDAADGDTLVYTTGGCGRSDDIRRLSEDLFDGHTVGWHAVVCFGYRFRDGHMHVLVLDNHTPTGPRRWIHVKEFHTLYTLTSLAPPSGRD